MYSTAALEAEAEAPEEEAAEWPVRSTDMEEDPSISPACKRVLNTHTHTHTLSSLRYAHSHMHMILKTAIHT